MVIKKYLTKKNFNTANKKNKYIVIHYTGNNGDTAWGNCNYFQTYRGASAHYFVDEINIYQSIEDKNIAWHCETKGMPFKCSCRNNNSIGIEMCSDIVNGKYVITAQTKANAIELTKYLMKKYGIPAERVIRHYDVCGKQCPEPWVRVSSEWSDFKKKITESKPVTPVETKKFEYVTATVNGRECKFTGFNEKNENWVKATAILEVLGYKAKWNTTKKRVIAVKNNKETLLDIRTYISIDSISFCPLRELCEYLGYKVEWNKSTKKITITG
jgi:hypothetical protein